MDGDAATQIRVRVISNRHAGSVVSQPITTAAIPANVHPDSVPPNLVWEEIIGETTNRFTLRHEDSGFIFKMRITRNNRLDWIDSNIVGPITLIPITGSLLIRGNPWAGQRLTVEAIGTSGSGDIQMTWEQTVLPFGYEPFDRRNSSGNDDEPDITYPWPWQRFHNRFYPDEWNRPETNFPMGFVARNWVDQFGEPQDWNRFSDELNTNNVYMPHETSCAGSLRLTNPLEDHEGNIIWQAVPDQSEGGDTGFYDVKNGLASACRLIRVRLTRGHAYQNQESNPVRITLIPWSIRSLTLVGNAWATQKLEVIANTNGILGDDEVNYQWQRTTRFGRDSRWFNSANSMPDGTLSSDQPNWATPPAWSDNPPWMSENGNPRPIDSDWDSWPVPDDRHDDNGVFELWRDVNANDARRVRGGFDDDRLVYDADESNIAPYGQMRSFNLRRAYTDTRRYVRIAVFEPQDRIMTDFARIWGEEPLDIAQMHGTWIATTPNYEYEGNYQPSRDFMFTPLVTLIPLLGSVNILGNPWPGEKLRAEGMLVSSVGIEGQMQYQWQRTAANATFRGDYPEGHPSWNEDPEQMDNPQDYVPDNDENGFEFDDWRNVFRNVYFNRPFELDRRDANSNLYDPNIILKPNSPASLSALGVPFPDEPRDSNMPTYFLDGGIPENRNRAGSNNGADIWNVRDFSDMDRFVRVRVRFDDNHQTIYSNPVGPVSLRPWNVILSIRGNPWYRQLFSADADVTNVFGSHRVRFRWERGDNENWVKIRDDEMGPIQARIGSILVGQPTGNESVYPYYNDAVDNGITENSYDQITHAFEDSHPNSGRNVRVIVMRPNELGWYRDDTFSSNLIGPIGRIPLNGTVFLLGSAHVGTELTALSTVSPIRDPRERPPQDGGTNWETAPWDTPDFWPRRTMTMEGMRYFWQNDSSGENVNQSSEGLDIGTPRLSNARPTEIEMGNNDPVENGFRRWGNTFAVPVMLGRAGAFPRENDVLARSRWVGARIRVSVGRSMNTNPDVGLDSPDMMANHFDHNFQILTLRTNPVTLPPLRGNVRFVIGKVINTENEMQKTTRDLFNVESVLDLPETGRPVFVLVDDLNVSALSDPLRAHLGLSALPANFPPRPETEDGTRSHTNGTGNAFVTFSHGQLSRERQIFADRGVYAAIPRANHLNSLMRVTVTFSNNSGSLEAIIGTINPLRLYLEHPNMPTRQHQRPDFSPNIIANVVLNLFWTLLGGEHDDFVLQANVNSNSERDETAPTTRGRYLGNRGISLNPQTVAGPRKTTIINSDTEGMIVLAHGVMGSLFTISSGTLILNACVIHGRNPNNSPLIWLNGGNLIANPGSKIVNNDNVEGNIPVPDHQRGGGVLITRGRFIFSGELSGHSMMRRQVGNQLPTNSVGAGIVVAGGTLDIRGGTISNNYADYGGGGIHARGGQINMRGGHIIGNIGGALPTPRRWVSEKKSGWWAEDPSHDNGGGGIFVQGGSVDIFSGEISYNTTSGWGGGINVFFGRVRIASIMMFANGGPRDNTIRGTFLMSETREEANLNQVVINGREIAVTNVRSQGLIISNGRGTIMGSYPHGLNEVIGVFILSFAVGNGGGTPPASQELIADTQINLPHQGNITRPSNAGADWTFGWRGPGVARPSGASTNWPGDFAPGGSPYRMPGRNTQLTAHWERPRCPSCGSAACPGASGGACNVCSNCGSRNCSGSCQDSDSRCSNCGSRSCSGC